MIYHVLPGDAVALEFAKVNLSGRPIVCRECLIVGPVDAENRFDFWNERAQFILAEYGEDEIEYHERVADELEKLTDIGPDDEVNLWFEYELFCQTNMWFCVSLLSNSGADIYRVAPSVRPREDIWKGFGSMTPEDLRRCLDERVRFDNTDIQLGTDLWTAYKVGDNDQLHQLGKSTSPCFSHLEEVCEAEIAKSTRPFRILTKIREQGISEFGEVFAEFSRQAGVYGYGDLQVQGLLDRL
jgi:Domain of unknown function (DUF1835)